ncbi:putative tRNA methyltransferase [Paratrimastix pyriformis]|uniref:tRNA (guanine-N(7)-)-methyltransferase n=1 Tax=Paratrimastix pyriformis TaxID=342808 RepID=A0ABQ8UP76_9EUKA|nr:putative tRNA methyltransferase [Paratrimastix pyriformis]
MSRSIAGRFRARPHSNPLSDQKLDYPLSPQAMNWKTVFTASQLEHPVPEWLDLGCGYGGLLEALGPRFPQTHIIGIEIRPKVVDYVRDRVERLRTGAILPAQYTLPDPSAPAEQPKPAAAAKAQGKRYQRIQQDPNHRRAALPVPADLTPPPPPPLPAPMGTPILVGNPPAPYRWDNIAAIHSNGMKYLPNFFAKGSLSKVFVLFPDPHWKRHNLRRRIISPALLMEYAYVMREGGLMYTITDVDELHVWMDRCLAEHPLFERVPQQELEQDPCYALIWHSTADAERAVRKCLNKYPAVYRRVAPGQKAVSIPPTGIWASEVMQEAVLDEGDEDD